MREHSSLYARITFAVVFAVVTCASTSCTGNHGNVGQLPTDNDIVNVIEEKVAIAEPLVQSLTLQGRVPLARRVTVTPAGGTVIEATVLENTWSVQLPIAAQGTTAEVAIYAADGSSIEQVVECKVTQ